MKKLFSFILALAVLVSVTTALPGSAEEDKVTIRFSFWDGGDALKGYQDAAKKFEELHPNIHVELLSIPAEYDTKLTAMIAGGTAPDVAELESSTIAFTLAEEGRVMDLAPLLAEDPEFSKDKLLPAITYYWKPGKIMGFALGPQIMCLYYSKPALEAAGITPPKSYEEAWTWDEFVENAKKLTLDSAGRNALDPNFDANNIVQYGTTAPTWFASGYNITALSEGTDYVTDDGSKLLLFDDPKFADSIQKIADLIYVHKVAPSPMTAQTMPGMVDAFATGAYATTINGHWCNLELMEGGVDYGVMPVPVIDKPVTTLMGGCLSIMSDTKHPKEAWEFYKFMCDPENTLTLIKSGLLTPMETEWYTDPEKFAKWAETEGHPDGYATVVRDGLLKYGKPIFQFYVKNFPKMNSIVSAALDKVWLGETTAAEALASVRGQVEPLFAGRYDR